MGRWFGCIAELGSENGEFCTHIERDNAKYIEPQKGQLCSGSEATYNPRLIRSSYCENITWAAELSTRYSKRNIIPSEKGKDDHKLLSRAQIAIGSNESALQTLDARTKSQLHRESENI